MRSTIGAHTCVPLLYDFRAVAVLTLVPMSSIGNGRPCDFWLTSGMGFQQICSGLLVASAKGSLVSSSLLAAPEYWKLVTHTLWTLVIPWPLQAGDPLLRKLVIPSFPSTLTTQVTHSPWGLWATPLLLETGDPLPLNNGDPFPLSNTGDDPFKRKLGIHEPHITLVTH